jgi:hypothetical protein
LAVPSRSDRTSRLVAFAPIAATLVIVAVQWSFTFMTTVDPLLPALLLAGFLPPHLHHLWATAHARRPRAGGVTLAAMALIYVAGVLLVGPQWYLAGAQLLASVLVVLRAPWSVLVAAVIAVAVVCLDKPPETIRRYAELFGRLQGVALGPVESRHLVQAVAEEYAAE